MLKYVSKIIALFVAMLVFFITGCSVKDTAKTLVEKSYAVCTNVEKIVLQTSTSEFISTMLIIKTPLSVVNTALVFIDNRITDEKAKEAISKAIVAITKINIAINTITPEKVDQVKNQIIVSLGDVKISLKLIGSLIGAQLPSDMTTIITDTTSNKLKNDLDKSTKELEDLLNKIK